MRTINPLDHIRENPAMYLPGGVPEPSHLAARMSYDALVLGATRTLVSHGEDWWTVAADVDWLRDASVSPEELFRVVVPFAKAGVNAMRSEVLLGAFASGVVTWERGSFPMVIKGEVGDPPGLWTMTADGAWARVVMFRLQPALVGAGSGHVEQ
jgi:hypothetical protein